MNIPAKFRLPALRPRRVSRTRVLSFIEEGFAQGRNILLVSAPPGSGKTTLVREWLESQKNLSAAWVSLGVEDSSPPRFLGSLISALQPLFAGVGEELLRNLESPHSPDCLQILETLLGELSAVEEPFILVLDDLHLADSPEVGELLNLLADHLPETLRLIITTRKDPDLPLPRLRVRNRITEIRTPELKFGSGEVREFFVGVMGLDLTEALMEDLEHRTEGWAAGLQLAALSLKAGRDPDSLVRSFTGSHAALAEYLTEEVLEDLPPGLKQQLLRSSLVEPFCGELFTFLGLGPGSGLRLLKELEERNLFLVALDQEGVWFRFHALFRDLLVKKTFREVPLAEIQELRLMASRWYEAQDLAEPAFSLALEAEDFPRAAAVAEKIWESMDQQFKTGTWLTWVSRIPEGVRQHRPVLLAQMGWSYMDASLTGESEACLKASEEALQNPSEESQAAVPPFLHSLPARIAVARTYNALVEAQPGVAEVLAQKALHLIPEKEVLLKAQAVSLLSGVHWSRGDLNPAAAALEEFSLAARKEGNLLFALMGASGRGDILRNQGKLSQAEILYRRILEESEAFGLADCMASTHLGLGLLLHERGEDSSFPLNRAFLLGEEKALVADWSYRKALAQSVLRDSRGDGEGALEYLKEAQRRFLSTPIPVLGSFPALKARVLWKAGRSREALSWAGAVPLPRGGELPDFREEFTLLTALRILCDIPGALDRSQKNSGVNCEKLLEGLLYRARIQDRPSGLVEVGLTLAMVRKAGGDELGAQEALQAALFLGDREGLVRSCAEGPETFRQLLAAADSAGMLPESIRKFLTHTLVESAAAKTLSLREPLSDREREVLSLVAQGFSNEEIGEKLFVSLSTVKGHNLRIFAKLQAKNRTEAVVRAREAGVL